MQKKTTLSQKLLLASLLLALGTSFSGITLAGDAPVVSTLYDASKKTDKKKISKKKHNKYTNSNRTVAGNTRDGITPKQTGKKKHHNKKQYHIVTTIKGNTPQGPTSGYRHPA